MLDASTCLDLLCACISLIFSVKSSQQLLHFGVFAVSTRCSVCINASAVPASAPAAGPHL